MTCGERASEIPPTAKEGVMRSLLDLADDYERWAAHDDAIVKEIMNNVDGCLVGVRDAQLLQASLLVEEARCFRQRAGKLRTPIANSRHTATIKTDLRITSS